MGKKRQGDTDFDPLSPASEAETSPLEWKATRISQLIDDRLIFVKNGFPQGEHNDSGSGVPHLRPFNVSEDGTIDLSQIKSVAPPQDDSNYWVRQEDVIFNNTNSEELVGKTALFPHCGRFVLSNHMTLLRVVSPSSIDPFWLAMAFYHQWRLGVFRALCRRHVNQASVSLERLKSISLAIPPLPEQRAIAEVLRTVQRAKEATEKVIAACRQLKQSLMRHLFTYGAVSYDKADQVELEETEIGEMPKHWHTTKLEPFANKITKGSSPKWQGFDYCDHGSVFVRSQNIGWGRLELEEIAYLPEQFNTEHQGSTINENDVLLNLVGASIGRAALADTRVAGGNLNQAVGIVRLKKGLDPSFVVNWLLTEKGQLQINQQKKEIARANISLQDVRNFFVPLPPLGEQEMIVDSLKITERKLAGEEQRHHALTTLFNTLLHHLMTGKVRVV
jgi:type I restriction enzyme, S subunit